MRTSGRALQAVGLLVGFYVLTVGVLIALAAIDVWLVLHTHSGTPVFAEGKVIGCSVVVAIPLVRGLAATRRRRSTGPPGIPLTRPEQPELWARVRWLAERVGTRAPAEIRLIPQVNAAVSEDARLMGLLPGRRRMYLGVPLLVGLTSAQLDAVLAHEMGHYGNRDVRLAATTVRGRTSVLAVARASQAGGTFVHRAMGSFFTWYAELYLRTSQSVSRRQEFAADRMAVRIAGRANSVAALRQIPALDLAYGFYLDRYVSMGWDAGLLPRPEAFYPGLYALLAEPSRQSELEALRGQPPQAEPTAYDSHPPVAERIAAIESLPDDGRVPADEVPAINLLRHAEQVCAQVAAAALPPEAATKRPVGWDELARGAGRAALERAAANILDTASTVLGAPVPNLHALLAAVDAGWLDAIAAALPKSERAQQATGRVAREFGRTAFRDAVTPLALLALIDSGVASWTHSWAHTSQLEYVDGWEEAVTAALTALVAEPTDTRPLRRLLDELPPTPAFAAPTGV